MVLGIDIGATKTWLARLDSDRLVTSAKIRTRSEQTHFLDDLYALIESFCGKDLRNVEAIGIGAPGPIDLDRGMFRKLPNLPGWDGFDVRGTLETCYDVPVKVQNDANAAALGEAVHGAGRGYHSVYYITISTGIGGGFIMDRRIINGNKHLTGEIWALPLDNFGRQDILINSSSGPGIVRTVKMLMDQGRESTLSTLETFDTADVYNHACQGDVLATAVMEQAARNMAYAINTVLLAVDPDVILIGGGLACEDDCMINPIREMLPRIAYFEEHRRANIQKAQLWDEAVLYGAVSLFNQ
jgi:glucokinase